MNHDQHHPDELEAQLLAHFRRHSSAEPSAELDARILAAAQAALVQQPQASWSERLHRWLFGSGRQRWSMALAGLACLGVGVSLTWRTLEQTPNTFDSVPTGAQMAPAPAAAPMARSMAPMAESVAMPEQELSAYEAPAAPAMQNFSADRAKAKAEKKLAAPSALEPRREQLADQQPEQQLEAAGRLSKSAPAMALDQVPLDQAASAAPPLHDELQRLLQLRREGWDEEADTLLLQLMRDYPQLDIEAALKQLQAAP